MHKLQDAITQQFFDYLKFQIISDKNVFESKVCRTDTLSASLIFSNNNKYRGDVSQTIQMDGRGRFDWADGDDYYQGDFKADKINGKGTMVFKNCSKIVGTLVNGVPHGDCKMTTKSAKYIGSYEYGKKNGNGMFYADVGNKEQLVFDGKWLNGEKFEGTRYYENGTFQGTFLDNQQNNGTYKFSNGEKYEGQFANNNFHGYGIYIWPQFNTSFEGYWQNGKKHGFGVIRLNELLVMTFWDNDSKSGPGLIKCNNGDIIISPELFKEDFLWNANLLGVFSNPQLITLLNNPTEGGLQNFINLHLQLSVAYNLTSISPFLHTDSYINIHQTDQIKRFIIDKYHYNNAMNGKSVTEILNYEIINLRTILAKLSSLLFTIFERRKLNRQIFLWNFIVRIFNLNNFKAYPSTLLKEANENFNLLIINLNDPNETIAYYQFLKLLVYLAITLYGEIPCKNELIGNISYCFLKLVRSMVKWMDEPMENDINLNQFAALDNEIHFARQYEPLKLRQFVESAQKKRRILKWAEEELFQAIEAIIPRFQRNGFVLDFHIPIMPVEFYYIYRKLIEIALMRGNNTILIRQ